MKKIIVPQESVNDDDVTVVTIKVTEKQKVSEVCEPDSAHGILQ